MRRLFGSEKKVVGPSLDETSQRLGDRANVMDKKIEQIDLELGKIRTQLKQTKSKPVQDRLKQRAIQLLRQRKTYEKQRNNMYGQQFNLEQAVFTTNTIKDSVDTVNAMKSAAKTMKMQMKDIGSIDRVYDVMDDMADLMADSNELQDIMSRSYDTPDFMDDDELLGELDALEDDMLTDTSASYLDDLTVPSQPTSQAKRVPANTNSDRDLERELGLI
jgi:charged multivesicular body protein 5